MQPAGEGTGFLTQTISPPSFWSGTLRNLRASTGIPDWPSLEGHPEFTFSELAVLPKETESLQLKLLGGHKGGGKGGSSVSMFTVLFVNDTIDVENFVFSIKITHFPGSLEIWLNQALGGGDSFIYLRVNRSYCSRAPHILCKIDRPKKKNAFNELSKGANWCNSASRLHVWLQLRGQHRFIQLSLIIYPHLVDQQDKKSLCF